MKVTKNGMNVAGLEVQIKHEEGVFTVGNMVVNADNPLQRCYQVRDKSGNVQLLTPVSNFLPVAGDNFEVDWQADYDIACPHCDHDMQCASSMLHKIGCFEFGNGNCPECDRMFAIRFSPYANRMIAEGLGI